MYSTESSLPSNSGVVAPGEVGILLIYALNFVLGGLPSKG